MSLKLKTLTSIDHEFEELSTTNFDGYSLAEAKVVSDDLLKLRAKVYAAATDEEVLKITNGAYLSV